MAPTEPFDIGPVGEDAMDGASKLEYALKAYEEVKEQSKQ